MHKHTNISREKENWIVWAASWKSVVTFSGYNYCFNTSSQTATNSKETCLLFTNGNQTDAGLAYSSLSIGQIKALLTAKSQSISVILPQASACRKCIYFKIFRSPRLKQREALISFFPLKKKSGLKFYQGLQHNAKIEVTSLTKYLFSHHPVVKG